MTVDEYLRKYSNSNVDLKHMDPYYKHAMATLISGMPEELRSEVRLTSGHRSAASQYEIIARKYRGRGQKVRYSNLGGGRYKAHGIPGIVASVSGTFKNGRFVPQESHSRHGFGGAMDITARSSKSKSANQRAIWGYLDKHGGKYGVSSLSGSAKRSDPYHYQMPRSYVGRDHSNLMGWRGQAPAVPPAMQKIEPTVPGFSIAKPKGAEFEVPKPDPVDPHVANSLLPAIEKAQSYEDAPPGYEVDPGDNSFFTGQPPSSGPAWGKIHMPTPQQIPIPELIQTQLNAGSVDPFNQPAQNPFAPQEDPRQQRNALMGMPGMMV